MVFLKEFFEKIDFESNQQTTKKHDELPSMLTFKLSHPGDTLGSTANRFTLRFFALSQTGSTIARTYLSPRCTLGLNRHSPTFFYQNILCDQCLHDTGLYIQKY